MVANDIQLKERVDALFNTNFVQREGRVVPASPDVTLRDGAVKIEAAFLYTDLAKSAVLSRVCPWTTTAKIIRAFLDASTRLIIKHGGYIRKFRWRSGDGRLCGRLEKQFRVDMWARNSLGCPKDHISGGS